MIEAIPYVGTSVEATSVEKIRKEEEVKTVEKEEKEEKKDIDPKVENEAEKELRRALTESKLNPHSKANREALLASQIFADAGRLVCLLIASDMCLTFAISLGGAFEDVLLNEIQEGNVISSNNNYSYELVRCSLN